MKKNDIITLTITGMTHDGSGVGRNDGIAVFVQNTAIGDEIQALVMKVKKNYAFAKILEILKPSADRISVDCPVFMKCGGCQYRHISYDSELKIKEQKVCDALSRVGKTDVKTDTVIPSEDILRYRNKGQYPFSRNSENRTVFGFFSSHSHRVAECDDCLLAPIEFRNLLNSVKEYADEYKLSVYDEISGKGLLRHMYLRRFENTQEIMAVIVANGDSLPNENELVGRLTANENVKSVILNINKENTNVILGEKSRVLYGKDYISDRLCGLEFRISLKSFYQVNGKQTEALYNKAAEYANLGKDDILLDLYCGVGTIGLTMAKYCKKLYGVEIIESAVENARENAKINGITNAEFYAGDAALLAKSLKDKKINPTAVVVDPPRKGCSSELIKTITDDFKPSRVVYVSCDPATLARDLQIFESNGYKADKATPVDMFPRTCHVETVVLMSRASEK